MKFKTTCPSHGENRSSKHLYGWDNCKCVKLGSNTYRRGTIGNKLEELENYKERNN